MSAYGFERDEWRDSLRSEVDRQHSSCQGHACPDCQDAPRGEGVCE